MTGFFRPAPHLLNHVDNGATHNLDAEYVHECAACVEFVHDAMRMARHDGATS